MSEPNDPDWDALEAWLRSESAKYSDAEQAPWDPDEAIDRIMRLCSQGGAQDFNELSDEIIKFFLHMQWGDPLPRSWRRER